MLRMIFVSLVAGFIAAEPFASRAAQGDPTQVPVPCLNTNDDGRMKIQPARPAAGPPQEVFGTLASWDPRTTTIGFRSELSGEIEQIHVKSIRFDLPEDNPVAQEARPDYQPLGSVSQSYRAMDVSVVEGVLRFPNCVAEHDGAPLAFEGTVTFTGTTVLLKGKVLKVNFPPASDCSRESTGCKTGG